MSLAPIQLFSTPQEDYAGWWLKFYEEGTTTPLAMATDVTGGTLLAKAEVSSGGTVPIGFLKTSGGALLNPFVNGSYDAWIFPTELEADEDTTTNAIQLADDLNADPLSNHSDPKVDEWKAGDTPTYISATSFTLVGDQTSNFHIGRRTKTTNTGGTIYSTIVDSVYGSLTTITVVNDSGVLDSGLTAVSYGFLSADNSAISAEAIMPVYGAAIASAAALPWPSYGNYNHITGTTTITEFKTSGQIGKEFKREFDGILTLTHHPTTLILLGGANIITAAGDVGSFIEYASGDVKMTDYVKLDGTSVVVIPVKFSLNTKIYDIGDWNMDTTASVSVAHNLTHTKIRAVTVLIRGDSGTTAQTLPTYDPPGTSLEAVEFDNTNVNIYRATAGFFDGSAEYDATSYNRGWIVVQYTD